MTKVLAVHQVARPQGFPTEKDFIFVEEAMPAVPQGGLLVENVYLSVDPYMREAMDEDWALRAPLEGRAIGRVVASRMKGVKEGGFVFHRKGWRTHAALLPGDPYRPLPSYRGVPVSAFLGLLGGTGLTAYVGLVKIAKLKKGETVFISAAAGGVGSAAGQIARLLGAKRIVGSAGSRAKVKHLLEDLGFDAAFDYHDGNVTELLLKAAPEGVDVCVENVGGEHLEAAIAAMKKGGRIAWSGAVSQYNTEPPTAPRNLYDVVSKAIRLEGYLVREWGSAQLELEKKLAPHIRSGRLELEHTIVDGFEYVVDAFLGVLKGRNVGKMLVRATPEDRGPAAI